MPAVESPPTTLKLLGLPFTASETDVRGFLSKHLSAEQIATLDSLQVGGKKAKKTGPSRGEGWATFLGEKSFAEALVQALDKQYIGDRFVEVSVLDEAENSSAHWEHSSAHWESSDWGTTTGNNAEGRLPPPEHARSGHDHASACDMTDIAPSSSWKKADSWSRPKAKEGSYPAPKMGSVALRLWGCPWDVSENAVQELLGASDAAAPKVSRILVGRTKHSRLRYTEQIWNQPCSGEAWVFFEGFDPFIGSEKTEAGLPSAEALDPLKTVGLKLQGQMLGSRYVECSVVDACTADVLWSAAEQNGGNKRQNPNTDDGTQPSTKKRKFEDTGPERELFVRFLPYEASEAEVRQFFEKAGEVAKVKLFRGMGFVVFAERNGAEQAIKDLDGAKWEERTLRVGWGSEKETILKENKRLGTSPSTTTAGEPGAVENRSKLFLTGLPFEWTDAEVEKVLGLRKKKSSSDETGESSDKGWSLELVRERGQFLGRAICDFLNDEAAAETALKYLQKKTAKADAATAGETVSEKNNGASSARGKKLAAKSRIRADFLRDKPLQKSGNGPDNKPLQKFQLFLKYLPLEADETQVKKQLFPGDGEDGGAASLVPPPIHFKLCKDRDGFSKGIAFAKFETKEDAEIALDVLNGFEFWDKHVEVTWAVEQGAREEWGLKKTTRGGGQRW